MKIEFCLQHPLTMHSAVLIRIQKLINLFQIYDYYSNDIPVSMKLTPLSAIFILLSTGSEF